MQLHATSNRDTAHTEQLLIFSTEETHAYTVTTADK